MNTTCKYCFDESVYVNEKNEELCKDCYEEFEGVDSDDEEEGETCAVCTKRNCDVEGCERDSQIGFICADCVEEDTTLYTNFVKKVVAQMLPLDREVYEKNECTAYLEQYAKRLNICKPCENPFPATCECCRSYT